MACIIVFDYVTLNPKIALQERDDYALELAMADE